MGGLLHPTGPMPPHIYWVRRILVLGLAAVILVTAWWVFVRGGAKDPVTATTVRTSVQNSNSASPGSSQSASGSSVAAMSAPPVGSSVSSSGSPTATVATNAHPSTSPSSSPNTSPKECADKQVTVAARVDRTAYPVGVLPLLGIAVTNVSSTPCLRDVGQRANQLTVTSGGKRVWSSDDCNPGGPGLERLLQPGEMYKIDVQWTRQTSKTGCPPGQAAGPGAYQLTARNGKLNSEPKPFALS